jgi:hypothetical protein
MNLKRYKNNFLDNKMEKHGRLGFTESALLYCHYIRIQKIDMVHKLEFMNYEANFLKWLFTTSGFYDISFNDNYEYINSSNYKKLMDEFYQMSKQSTFTRFAFHNTSVCKYLPEFYKNFNNIEFSFEKISNEFKLFVRDKNILIINPMSKLMKQQYESGNVFKINNFPRVNSIQCYTNDYTFFNKSNNSNHQNHSNSFDYIDSIMPEILSIECDCVIISCGAISSLIANRLNKNYLIIGSNLLTIFGIKHDRIKDHSHEYNENWINVPDEYKPSEYKMIENGCYW